MEVNTKGTEELEPWPEPVDGQLLLDDLAHALRRHVVLPQWGKEAVALWSLHTFAFPLRHISTYLGIESPEKQCGKTTLLALLGKLVSRPEIAANISPPAFFRVIEETRPTLLIDEGDTFLRRNGELRGIMNAGYTRETAYVVRVANQERQSSSVRPSEWAGGNGSSSEVKASRLVRFSCFCPKAIASIGRLPETLADRCIVIRMHRKTALETCERSRNLDTTDLKRKCIRFVKDNAEAIASARPRIPAGLADRAADIWEPLLVLADLAGGHWPDTARQAMEALTAGARENNPIGSLFLDLLLIFVNGQTERMFSRTLSASLERLVERPWTEMRKGKPVTEAWLATQLRPYGVRPKTLWIGENAAKGYLLADFRELFARYIPPSEVEALRAASKKAGENIPSGEPAGPKADPSTPDGNQAAESG